MNKEKLRKLLFEKPDNIIIMILNITINLTWVFLLGYFINKSIINTVIIMIIWTFRMFIGKAKHYKSPLSCFLLQVGLFSSLFVSTYINIYAASVFTILTMYLLSGYADIKIEGSNVEAEIKDRSLKDLTLWNPKNDDDNRLYNDLIVNRIKDLCKEKNISYYRLAKNSRLAYSTLMSYINRINPSTSPLIIKKICEGLEIKEYKFYDHKYFKK